MDPLEQFEQLMRDIADAIREKKGTSDPIDAQDFADEIRNLNV